MQDYRDVVDYFTSYRGVVDHLISYRGVGDGLGKGKIRGVKINCKGDQRAFGASIYSAVDVPKGHPVFNDPIAPISRLVGMAVHTRKYP